MASKTPGGGEGASKLSVDQYSLVGPKKNAPTDQPKKLVSGGHGSPVSK